MAVSFVKLAKKAGIVRESRTGGGRKKTVLIVSGCWRRNRRERQVIERKISCK